MVCWSTTDLLAVEPNDPFLDDAPQGTPLAPEEYQWGLHAMNFPLAWDYARGHAMVGVVDFGMQVDHPDLQAFSGSSYVGGNLREHLCWDYQGTIGNANVDDQPDVYPGPNVNAHGTAVSGAIAATTDNGLGVAAGCWHCSFFMSQGARRITSR